MADVSPVRRGKPGPLLPTLLERIPFEVLSQFRMEAPPATTPTPAPASDAKPPEGAPPPATGDDLGDAGKQAIDRMKAERNEAQKAAKAATAELEKLRTAQMGESERAVAEAKAAGRSEALAQIGNKLVDAEFRAVTVGRVLTPDALLSFDRATFLADDGDVKRDDLAKWVEANSSPVGNPRPTGNADLGARQTAGPLDPRAADLLQIEKDMAADRRH